MKNKKKNNVFLFGKIACMMLLGSSVIPHRVLAESAIVQQNQVTIKGVVTDTTGEPLIGVSVSIKGTGTGTMTSIDGDYTLKVPEGDHTLVFSYVGYVKHEVNTKGKTTIDVILKDDEQMLQEVVVVGYGVQKKINLTGAVSAIDANQVENRATPNLSTSLSGLSPGMNISQKSGNPGSEDVSFSIRGVGSFNGSSPMILVDGSEASMNSVNPDDVASISILKDGASAAIYGSRAANGVILITTKKGTKDSAPKITYSNIFASQKAVTNWKLMSDMPSWMSWENQAVINNNISATLPYSQSLIDTWAAANTNPNGIDNGSATGVPNWVMYPNTDWSQVLFKASFFQRHNLSVTGGGKDSNYLLSVGYQDNPGTMSNTRQQRFNIRANVESKIGDILTFGTQTFGTKTLKDPGNVTSGMTYLLQAYPGMVPEYQGKYGSSEDPNITGMNNILQRVNSRGGEDESTTINSTWFLKANIWDGLSAEVKFNYLDIHDESETYTKNSPTYRFNQSLTDPIEQIVNVDQATTSRSFLKNSKYLLNFLLYYNKQFGDHSINALVGYEQTYWKKTGFAATKKGLIDWNITDINTESGEMSSIGDKKMQKVDYAMISYFGRVNYDYKGKYLMEVNFRSDGSSRYAPNHRWGYFPSFSAGWRISDETFFMPFKEKINDLKIRASWGKLGNTIDDQYYAWQALYGAKPGVMDNSVSSGLAMTQPSNYTLSWESVATTDLGFDIFLLNKRLNVSFDVYERRSSNILDQPNISLSLGTIEKQMANTAKMSNKGMEFVIGWNDAIDKVRYNVSFNGTYNKNKVTKYRGDLNYGQIDGQYDIWGRPQYGFTNLGDASTEKTTNTRRVEGHMIDEYFLQTPYSGSGSYYDVNGKVDPNGGPRDGMIRTKSDLEWVKAMQNAGYSFNGVKVDSPVVDANGNITGGRGGYLWYGEQIMADSNGDGNYGDDNDRKFTGKSSSPKWMFGLTLGAQWNGFDFSMTWDAKVGGYAYMNSKGVNGNISNSYDAIPGKANSLYYQYDAVASVTDYANYDPANDPNANIGARYSRLLTAGSVAKANTNYLYNTSFLKLRALQVGYTLPKKWVSAAKLSKVRVFFAGENLLTIKKGDFLGVDPELGSTVAVYPMSRMFSGGLNVTF